MKLNDPHNINKNNHFPWGENYGLFEGYRCFSIFMLKAGLFELKSLVDLWILAGSIDILSLSQCCKNHDICSAGSLSAKEYLRAASHWSMLRAELYDHPYRLSLQGVQQLLQYKISTILLKSIFWRKLWYSCLSYSKPRICTGAMYEVCKEGKTGIGHVNEYPTIHYFGNPKHSVNDSIYDFDWVFLEIPVKNCIVGMLLTCHIVFE